MEYLGVYIINYATKYIYKAEKGRGMRESLSMSNFPRYFQIHMKYSIYSRRHSNTSQPGSPECNDASMMADISSAIARPGGEQLSYRRHHYIIFKQHFNCALERCGSGCISHK